MTTTPTSPPEDGDESPLGRLFMIEYARHVAHVAAIKASRARNEAILTTMPDSPEAHSIRAQRAYTKACKQRRKQRTPTA